MPSAFGKPVTTANRFGAVATSSAWTLVTTLTAETSASLSYTSFDISGTYHSYMFYFSGFVQATDLARLNMQASIDGGANYGTLLWQSSIDNQGTGTTSGGIQAPFGTPLQTVGLQQGAIDKTNFPSQVFGTMIMQYGVTGSDYTSLRAEFESQAQHPAQGQTNRISSMMYKSTTRVNALKFLSSSGNITRGTIKIYGIA